MTLARSIALTARQRRLWLTLAGAAPGEVRTVAQLLEWVRSRKAQLAGALPADALSDRSAALDALFEWCSGQAMPDPPLAAEREVPQQQVDGHLASRGGGRHALERELLGLVVVGQGDGDRARAIVERISRRGAPRLVR
jgi:hypothetical protein